MQHQSLSVVLALLAFIASFPVRAQEPACPPDLSGNGPFEKPLTDCFAELLKRADALEGALADAKSQRGGLPIGTIIASYLSPGQFAKALNEAEGDSLSKRTWILSDGREVTGTKFAVLTGGKPVPDLRGMFLRGASETREAGDIEQDSTALPRNFFSGVTSAELPLDLPSAASPSGVDRYDAGGRDYPVITAARSQPVPAHAHTVVINAGGDEETRPVNVAVFYYIKIN